MVPNERELNDGLPGLLELGSLMEATPEPLILANPDGRILYANHRLEEMTGFRRDELVGQPAELVVSMDLGATAPGAHVDTFCRRREGEPLPVELRMGLVDGPSRLLVVTLRDATDLLAGREARFEAEAKYRALVEEIPAVVYLDPVGENASGHYVSPQVTQLLGVTQQDWLADPSCWRSHVHHEDVDRVWAEYREAYETHTPLNREYRMVHEDGTVKWVLEQAFPVNDEHGSPWLVEGVIFDITERKKAEEEVAYLAYHDKLTGLPNRVLFEEMLGISLARARRHDLGVGVIYLDLDNFKLVNDSLGHAAGDALLVQLADRLRGCTRETDLVARQGGDEFLLLLSDLERGPGVVPGTEVATIVAESVAERVREALHDPFDLGGVRFYATASVGVSLYPHDALDAESLLSNADTAMYQSKRMGPGGYAVYTSGNEDPMQRLALSSRLRKAVEDRNWVLHYQPLIDLGTGSMTGVEALIRWQEPNGGLIAPGEFIPLAEEMGLIEAIGDWVIDELIDQHRTWRTEGLGLEMSFNLSPRQLWSANLSEKIVGKLQRAGIDPHEVVVEITESTAMADPERTQRVLSELHAWGLTLAIDDFGTGYSSLARLKHMPVDILKIDQAFIRDVDRNRDLAGMVRAMIQLAQSLGMLPLAEGIETSGEYEFLRANGCRLAQGFLFSRPVPPEEIPALARREGGLVPAPLAMG
ncbi:MAG: EAL domain-containing protein [Actinobacteria bacterium]|nr:EAL domain-containing protein [Actinomycetota bacterium]